MAKHLGKTSKILQLQYTARQQLGVRSYEPSNLKRNGYLTESPILASKKNIEETDDGFCSHCNVVVPQNYAKIGICSIRVRFAAYSIIEGKFGLFL